MNPEKHILHIKTPELQNTKEVQDSVERRERLNQRALENAREIEQETGEQIDSELFNIKIPNDPTQRLNIYMDRIEKIFLNPDEKKRIRNLKLLKPYVHDEFIIKPGQVPESYFHLQQQVLREQGIDAEVIPEETKKEMIETIIKDQKNSLDNWVEYLASDDAVYPTWFKYIVFQNITKLSQFDKNLGKFKERTDTTVAPYPDVYREPLAQICDIYEQVANDNKLLKTDPEIQKEFSKKFSKLYAELITKSLSSSIENREQIEGEWIKYSYGNLVDAEKLYKSLDSKGTGWCTAGLSTSKAQINSGDFYVYYTHNQSNEPIQPRVAIRMNGTSQVGEVRGILQHQALEPQFNDVLEDKLNTFGSEADKFKKKTADMRLMTEIEKKTNDNQPLTKQDLTFLYELNSSIEGFGYDKDPRIEEIRTKRNIQEDTLIIFECTKNQIATSKVEIDENTKAYIGPWNIDVYNTIKEYSNIIHLYESFPDKKIFTYELQTDQSIQTPEQAQQKLEEKNMYISDYGKDLLHKTEFSKEQNTYKLVQFTVEQLGFKESATTDQVYTKAQELGLKLCPAEVGPLLRLAYAGEDWKLIAMKQITDRDGFPRVFYLNSDDAELRLNGYYSQSDDRWSSDSQFVFLAH